LTSSTGFTLLSPVDSNFQASLGNVHLPTTVFIHCLIAAGCNTIRLKAYGQKMPMTEDFLHNEPAQTDHRWAEHNEWDIGTSFASPYIWLFASATGRRHGIKHFPMLVPGSCDYGTVNLRQSHRGRHFSIKIYPRLVHVIKSFNSHLQGGIPRTLRGVRNQLEAALRMIHSLTGRDGMGLGGFRIEVTVKHQACVRPLELSGGQDSLILSIGSASVLDPIPVFLSVPNWSRGKSSWRMPTGCTNRPLWGTSSGVKPATNHPSNRFKL
jgi:hypothetical protein